MNFQISNRLFATQFEILSCKFSALAAVADNVKEYWKDGMMTRNRRKDSSLSGGSEVGDSFASINVQEKRCRNLRATVSPAKPPPMMRTSRFCGGTAIDASFGASTTPLCLALYYLTPGQTFDGPFSASDNVNIPFIGIDMANSRARS